MLQETKWNDDLRPPHAVVCHIGMPRSTLVRGREYQCCPVLTTAAGEVRSHMPLQSPGRQRGLMIVGREPRSTGGQIPGAESGKNGLVGTDVEMVTVCCDQVGTGKFFGG